MKTLIVLIGTVVLLSGIPPRVSAIPESSSPGEDVQVMCSPDLYALMEDFLNAYRTSGGKLSVSIRSNAALEPGEWIGEPGNMALVSKYHMTGLDPRRLAVFVIGREVYVPVVSPDHPFLKELLEQGISPQDFALIYTGNAKSGWGDILRNGSKVPAEGYRTNDPIFTEYLAEFLETDPKLIKGTVLDNFEQVITSVLQNRNGVGFCTLSQLVKLKERGVKLEVTMVPVDLNDNNTIDHFENIYGSVDELYRGIWMGKYNRSLYSRIFVLTGNETAHGPERELLAWIITGGKGILEARGYTGLNDHEEEVMMARLDNASNPLNTGDGIENPGNAGLTIVAVLLGIGIIVVLLFWLLRDRKFVNEVFNGSDQPPIIEESSVVPGGYYYDRSHTWAFQEKDGSVRIGLDSFIERLTGPISRVDLKKPGEELRKGQTIFTLVQNGKRLNIKSPVTGKIQAINEQLLKDATLINSSPFAEGWVYLVEPGRWVEELPQYLRAPGYRDWIKSEFSRLKDFMAQLQRSRAKIHVILQDGGEIEGGILEDLGPEIWEDFQMDFLKNQQ